MLGGTWASYPVRYQEQFCRDLFFAANTFFDRPRDKRPKMSLRREKAANEEARVKIIGLTLETRPDTIDAAYGYDSAKGITYFEFEIPFCKKDTCAKTSFQREKTQLLITAHGEQVSCGDGCVRVQEHALSGRAKVSMSDGSRIRQCSASRK